MLRQREVSPFLSILELDGVNLDPIHGFLKVVSVTVSLPPLSFHSSHHTPPAPPYPNLNVCQKELEWAPAWSCVKPFPFLSPFFPRSFITSGKPQLGTDPQRGTVWFFREQETHHGNKLWASAVCAQPCRFAPAPKPHKVLIQGKGRAQAVAEFTTSRLSITLTAQ